MLAFIRFPGQYFDEETGLHYNRFRYYDPAIGRYVSADPIGQFGLVESALPRHSVLSIGERGITGVGASGNLFSFVSNAPTVFVDPSGLLWWSWGHGGKLAAGVGKEYSTGRYTDLETGEYGRYTSRDDGIGRPGGAVTNDFAVGAGSDPGGTSWSFSASFTFPTGLFCSVGIGGSDKGALAKFSFGFGWPPGPGGGGGQSETAAEYEGNFYRDADDAIKNLYRRGQFPPEF